MSRWFITPLEVPASKVKSSLYGLYSRFITIAVDISRIKPEDYHYDLPETRIASTPLSDRTSSKLLFYEDGNISDHQFSALPELVRQPSLFFFNDTRVIPARLILWKDTGARIEIFLLEPVQPSSVVEEVMNSYDKCAWKCLIGNARKFKIENSLHLETDDFKLKVVRIGEDTVELHWTQGLNFSQLIERLGKIPLPPYIKREPNQQDSERYQTVFSRHEGAVAAPTAGLHFDDHLMQKLSSANQIDYVTLHVSAGTFQPIQTNARDHNMHREQIIINRRNLEHLLAAKQVIAVGTTSMRTLESAYWLGVRIISKSMTDFHIPKLTPYEEYPEISKEEALEAVLNHMQKHDIERFIGNTEIFIVPGYKFKVVDGLVTNFHLPGTTLMMLVAAFVGPDWERIYQHALSSDYRFLSYGDSSLLMRNFDLNS